MTSLRQAFRRAVKLLRLLPDPTFRRGQRSGVGAAIEHRAALAPLRLRTIVDVGANVGQFSLLARALNPGARIVAFEPLAQAAARYRRVFAGDDRAKLIQAAVAPQRGPATLHLSAAADSSSLLPITPKQVARFPGTQEAGLIPVAAGPLDDYLDRADIAAPALLKIDVQGFELEVLRASLALLEAFEHVYVEASFEELYAGQALVPDVRAYLGECGFREMGQFNTVRLRDGTPVQADFLFQRLCAADASTMSASSSALPKAAASAAVPTGSARHADPTSARAPRRSSPPSASHP